MGTSGRGLRAGGDSAGAAGILWVGVGLLWFAGIDLRVTMLAVPPVLPLIHRDLGLNETGIAVLTGLPVVLFAAAAVPGSLLIARLGARRALIMGILVVAVASGLRGAAASTALLFIMTFLMGVGIAVAQPAIPTLVQAWFPAWVVIATGIYVNGVLVGETLSASLTLPVVLPLVRGSWELSFVVWGGFVLATSLLMVWLTRLMPDVAASSRTLWWPDWNGAQTWQLGLLLGGAGAAYFGSNAFIPDFLRASGRPQLIGASLTMLNAGQLPVSLIAGLFASKIVGRRQPFLLIGAATLGGLAVFLSQRGWGVVLGAGLLGFCLAFALVLILALPPLLATRGDVHRLSAGMFTIGYACSFAIPLLGGAAWDLSHVPAASFLPVAVGALLILAAAFMPALRPGRN